MHTPDFEPVQRGRRRMVMAAPLLALGLGAQPALARAHTYRTTQALMGTQVDLTLQGAQGPTMIAAAGAAYTEMSRLADMMSCFRSTSELNAINLMAGLQAVPISLELMRVLVMARQAHTDSGGGFDATVGSLRGWSFDPSHPRIPDASEIAQQLPLVDQTHGLVLDQHAGTAYLRQRGMRLDLGGVAKLPILQAGMQKLQTHGVFNAMINGGGDVIVNSKFDSRPWRIGLRDPRRPEQLLGVVSLTQGIVAASGDYERFVIQNGQRLHHILDPKTGYPSHGPRGVALVSESLASINGLGAAIMVAGGERGQSWLKQRPDVDALIVNADGSTWTSTGMKNRLG